MALEPRQYTQKDLDARKETDHPREIRVCNGKACMHNNSRYLMKRIEGLYGVKAGQKNKNVDLAYTECLGRCKYGPNIKVNGEVLMKTQVHKLKDRIESSIKNPLEDENKMAKELMARQFKAKEEGEKKPEEQPLAQSLDELFDNDFLGDI